MNYTDRWAYTELCTRNNVTHVKVGGHRVMTYDVNTGYIGFPVFIPAVFIKMRSETVFESWIIAAYYTMRDFLETIGIKLTYSDGFVKNCEWYANQTRVSAKNNVLYRGGSDVIKTWTRLYNVQDKFRSFDVSASMMTNKRRGRVATTRVAALSEIMTTYRYIDDDFPVLGTSECSSPQSTATSEDDEIDVEELVRLCIGSA